MSRKSSTTVYAGPFELAGNKGIITRADRELVMQSCNGCSVAIRKRKKWPERMLTISGPAKDIDRAKNMAFKIIRRSVRLGREGEEITPGSEDDPWPPLHQSVQGGYLV